MTLYPTLQDNNIKNKSMQFPSPRINQQTVKLIERKRAKRREENKNSKTGYEGCIIYRNAGNLSRVARVRRIVWHPRCHCREAPHLRSPRRGRRSGRWEGARGGPAPGTPSQSRHEVAKGVVAARRKRPLGAETAAAARTSSPAKRWRLALGSSCSASDN